MTASSRVCVSQTPAKVSLTSITIALAAIGVAALLAYAKPAQAQSVTVHATTQQTFQGFGLAPAAFGEQYYFASGSYSSASLRDQVYDALFTDLDLRFIRFPVQPTFQTSQGGAFDFQTAVVGNNQAAAAQAARARNSNIKVMYSVWSPPAWMKYNNNVNGSSYVDDPNQSTSNKLAYNLLDTFGDYLAEFCKEYKSNLGFPVSYISPQNEPNLNVPYQSCVYTQDEYRYMLQSVQNSIRNHYGNSETLILGPEYSYAGGDYTQYVNDNSGSYLDLLCIHGYASSPDRANDMGLVPAATRNSKPFFETEFYSETGTTNDDPIQSAMIGNGFAGDTGSGNAAAWFFWQGVESANNGSPTEGLILTNGDYTSGAAITAITRTRRYYAFQQLTQSVKASAVSRATDVSGDLYGSLGDVKAAGFQNSDGNFVVVIANKTSNVYNNVTVKFDELSSSGNVPFLERVTDGSNSNVSNSVTFNNGVVTTSLSAYSVVTFVQNGSAGSSGGGGGGTTPSGTLYAGQTIALKGANNLFLSAGGPGNQLMCSTTSAANAVYSMEQFIVIDKGNNVICLQVRGNNEIVTAPNGGTSALIANTTNQGTTEQFQIIDKGNNTICLKSLANSNIVQLTNGGADVTDPLIANTTDQSSWEQFQVTVF